MVNRDVGVCWDSNETRQLLVQHILDYNTREINAVIDFITVNNMACKFAASSKAGLVTVVFLSSLYWRGTRLVIFYNLLQEYMVHLNGIFYIFLLLYM